MSKSGQLIECINPEHLYLGSIHYRQDSCVGKLDLSGEIGLIGIIEVDSDESWQASEALLVNPLVDPCDPEFNVDDDYAS